MWYRFSLTRFLSTPSARRATVVVRRGVVVDVISIHALREEGDRQARTKNHPDTDFYPRPPRGGRPVVDGDRPRDVSISIHALREEGDPIEVKNKWDNDVISIHALREEGDCRR